MSPTRQCGKSNTIKVLSMLAHDPQAASNMTAAALFRLCDEHGTVIIDEADNFELFTDPQKRAVINSGFDKTASTVRRVQATYDVHTPMVFGGIGRLPLPLMDRSLCIHLERSLKDYPVLNPDDEVMRRPFDEAFTLIKDWAEDEDVKLNPNPEMPFGVRARTADKWKVLIAIADSFGPEWGERAREAAVAFRSSYSDEEVQTMLLLDCETVFKQRHVERIRSEELLSAILDLDTHYPWMAYRGPKDDENTLPRKLKQGDMARLLGMFRIRSKKIRFNPAPNGSFMGYERQDFQKFWDTYGTKSGTPELKAIAGGKK
jgi:putative DNA primase/helicase